MVGQQNESIPRQTPGITACISDPELSPFAISATLDNYQGGTRLQAGLGGKLDRPDSDVSEQLAAWVCPTHFINLTKT